MKNNLSKILKEKGISQQRFSQMMRPHLICPDNAHKMYGLRMCRKPLEAVRISELENIMKLLDVTAQELGYPE